jgi:hypothetical protein
MQTNTCQHEWTTQGQKAFICSKCGYGIFPKQIPGSEVKLGDRVLVLASKCGIQSSETDANSKPYEAVVIGKGGTDPKNTINSALFLLGWKENEPRPPCVSNPDTYHKNNTTASNFAYIPNTQDYPLTGFGYVSQPVFLLEPNATSYYAHNPPGDSTMTTPTSQKTLQEELATFNVKPSKLKNGDRVEVLNGTSLFTGTVIKYTGIYGGTERTIVFDAKNAKRVSSVSYRWGEHLGNASMEEAAEKVGLKLTSKCWCAEACEVDGIRYLDPTKQVAATPKTGASTNLGKTVDAKSNKRFVLNGASYPAGSKLVQAIDVPLGSLVEVFLDIDDDVVFHPNQSVSSITARVIGKNKHNERVLLGWSEGEDPARGAHIRTKPASLWEYAANHEECDKCQSVCGEVDLILLPQPTTITNSIDSRTAMLLDPLLNANPKSGKTAYMVGVQGYIGVLVKEAKTSAGDAIIYAPGCGVRSLTRPADRAAAVALGLDPDASDYRLERTEPIRPEVKKVDVGALGIRELRMINTIAHRDQLCGDLRALAIEGGAEATITTEEVLADLIDIMTDELEKMKEEEDEHLSQDLHDQDESDLVKATETNSEETEAKQEDKSIHPAWIGAGAMLGGLFASAYALGGNSSVRIAEGSSSATEAAIDVANEASL